MDIWVRSQDKDALIKINTIYIEQRVYNDPRSLLGGIDYCYDLLGVNSDTDKITLGTFKRYADVLQVINDFEKHVNKMQNMLLNRLNHTDTLGNYYDIFQIPEDKDV